MQLQTTSPESKFPNEYSDVIFIQIYQYLKKLLQKYKGSRFYESRCILHLLAWSQPPMQFSMENFAVCRLSETSCHVVEVHKFISSIDEQSTSMRCPRNLSGTFWDIM